jgi:hypothetical protein
MCMALSQALLPHVHGTVPGAAATAAPGSSAARNALPIVHIPQQQPYWALGAAEQGYEYVLVHAG